MLTLQFYFCTGDPVWCRQSVVNLLQYFPIDTWGVKMSSETQVLTTFADVLPLAFYDSQWISVGLGLMVRKQAIETIAFQQWLQKNWQTIRKIISLLQLLVFFFKLLYNHKCCLFQCLCFFSAAGCTFEEDSDPSLCDFTQGEEDDFDWLLFRTYSSPYASSDLLRGEWSSFLQFYDWLFLQAAAIFCL